MDVRFSKIADQLLLIERELRLQGWWDDVPPSAAALSSVEPFSVDTLEFEQWLQWIFLPRMKAILEQDLPLPNASGIQEMAEMVFGARSLQGKDRQLQVLLKEFDQLISASR
ncbi:MULTISPECIES: YqcC family protein [unclassified Pseudomonas]|uniref:YqcC family protein n=1 Tax=unclassified Pseudomonas TaxID=196821 RepID=UPI000BA3AC43|nr:MULTISPECIES: YqcC family protein [unclassified Pseudomonas]POA18544.1 pseudouridine synthase [Pseudomonas sp. FW300-N1A1]